MKDIVMSNVNNTPMFTPSEVKHITESLDKKMIEERKNFVMNYLSQPVDPNATITPSTPEERQAFFDSVISVMSEHSYADNVIETDLSPAEQVKTWCNDAKLWQVHARKWQRKNAHVKKMSRKAWKVFENKIKREAKVTDGTAKYRSTAKAYTKFLKDVSRTTGYINFSLPMNIVLGKNGYEPVIAESFLSGINCPSDIQVKTKPLTEEDKAQGFSWGMKVELSVSLTPEMKATGLFDPVPGAISIREDKSNE